MSNKHDNILLAAHYGLAKTLYNIKQKYYWPMMNRDISNYVLSCETCARANNSNNAKIPMVQREISKAPFQCVFLI